MNARAAEGGPLGAGPERVYSVTPQKPGMHVEDEEQRPFFRRVLRSLARQPASRPAADIREVKRVIALCHALLSERGEVSGARLAHEVATGYQSLSSPAREIFFDSLADEFSADPRKVALAADAHHADPSQKNLLRLQAAVEAPNQELFRRINMAAGGTGALIQMRADLLRTLGDYPRRTGIDADLLHLFRSWFNRGFLVLQRIDWRTSALILERLIHHEAVHQIQGWRDLRRRLEADRRCYAFFHPALPDELLIFIEVALTRGMAASVQPLIDPDSEVVDPAVADCAVFYSITNCQEGLRGVSFGNFLIKQVAEDLGRELPRLKTFTTLSPIPGFRMWLSSATDSSGADLKSPQLSAWLAKLDAGDSRAAEAAPAHLKTELTGLCAYYLLKAKAGQVPLDTVARFHLANGARLERLNWQGDTSDAGMRRSLGLMAHYVYRLADMERNHEDYAREGRIVASREVRHLAESFRPGDSRRSQV